MTFDDLDFQPRGSLSGVQAKAFFPNGYGVSVVKGFGSYGNERGLYELAVLKGTEMDWDLTYETPVTADVIGHLEPEDVTTMMEAVASLEPA